MKAGDLVRFKTGATATVIEASDDFGGYAVLYCGDGTLDNTPSSDGITHMSYQMLQRTAEVVSESR